MIVSPRSDFYETRLGYHKISQNNVSRKRGKLRIIDPTLDRLDPLLFYKFFCQFFCSSKFYGRLVF